MNFAINNLMTIFNTKDQFLKIKGLEFFLPEGFPKGKNLMIAGDTGSGKSLYALSLVSSNKELSFLYIDTHFQIKNMYENMYLFRDNDENTILNFLNSIEKNDLDVIILDDLSYIKTNEKNRYEEINKFYSTLSKICFKKNICLIVLNVLNGQNKIYNLSDQIQKNTNNIILFDLVKEDQKNVFIKGKIKKSKYINKDTEFNINTVRM